MLWNGFELLRDERENGWWVQYIGVCVCLFVQGLSGRGVDC